MHTPAQGRKLEKNPRKAPKLVFAKNALATP